MTAAAPTRAPSASASVSRGALLVAALVVVLAGLCLVSIAYGALRVPVGDVARTLFGDPPTTRIDHVVWSVRVPRTILGIAAGAALGLSGAVMQAITRNPLADPGILGVSAGATFAIVLAVGSLGVGSLYGYIWFGFAGALAAGAVVYALGGLGRSGSTPVKLALAGVAVTAMLNSFTNGIVLTDPEALNRYRFWSAGSLAGQDAGVVKQVLPFLVVGAILALACAPALNSLALGDDVAAALGRRIAWVRFAAAAAITLLTGGAVAVIGPVVFVGLVVPHMARILARAAGIGPDQRWLLPLSALLASCLLLAADLAGRLIARPVEIQAGVLVAVIGGPFFIALVRRRRLAEV
ncbi:iron chelate uptake ABC transporter family permease subunit [Actinomadura barringtoniae]|uniref:Iron chelate uptake ABC transporter family permease subunit n=1 Tax=Actinomadura barringtoniae TaxID=1427535 RepID=A0A939P602_9ACTN|nr:iron chelate uptake ABC transporter family permease subunit [Actinomadura barringtoniae]